MKLLERYGLKERYKGTVLKILDDFKVIVQIDDLILSKPNTQILVENVSSSNIINSDELSLENKLETINGIICRPMFINNTLTLPNEGDTVMVMLFNKDPKKIFYLNITNDKPSKNVLFYKDKNHYMVENENKIEIKMGKNTFTMSDEEIEIIGTLKINGKKMEVE